MLTMSQKTHSDYNHLDPTMVNDIEDVDPGAHGRVPRLSSGRSEMHILHRKQNRNDGSSAPMHVLFNQAASLCTKFNKQIKGTAVQQHFVQKLVSTIRGFSLPLLYFNAPLFPRHYWSGATHDEHAILGCAPISCYNGKTHPNGFASLIQQARNLVNHASSSTATCTNFIMHLYDGLTNLSLRKRNSVTFVRSGLKVSTTGPSGLEAFDKDVSQLTECYESSQAMMNLAAANTEYPSDLFLTFSANQKDHPGIRHLYDWKESKLWTRYVDGYHTWFQDSHRRDVDKSMEMAYTHMLSRCWLETRRLWLLFLMESSNTALGKVTYAFFRDEYQECSGNLSHIHGLMRLERGDRTEEEFLEFVCSLQKNSVFEIISSRDVQKLIEKGLLKNTDDWHSCQQTAQTVLPHTYHSNRCQMRVNHTGDPSKDFRCRKHHPVFDGKDCKKDDFIDLPYEFSEQCLDILQEVDLYDPPFSSGSKGTFKHPMLRPKRHIGVVHPGARDNCSPVITEHFAFTRSMQNMQVITGTNGVTRYVVKVRVVVETLFR
jgi:hypothetical protein